MSIVSPALRTTALRPARAIVSIIEGGMSEAVPGQERLELLATPDPAEPAALTPGHYQTALSLLEYAAKALEILYDRRDQLEAAIEDVSMRAEDAVMAAQAKVLEWHNLATSLKNDGQELERRLAAMQQRAELAETQLDAERARAEAAEQQAAEALGLSQGLHSRIISAFGRGSPAHKALLVAVDDPAAAPAARDALEA